MQLNSSYLYPVKIEFFQNGDSFITERYHQVYQRTYYLYKGVDNRLDIHVKNSDQKSKNTTGLTLVFNITASDSGELVSQKDCIAYDTTSGRYYVNFSEQELYDIKAGFYGFSLHTVDSNGTKRPAYGDAKHDARGQLEVRGTEYGKQIESTEIDTFNLMNDGYYYSSVVDARPEFNSNAGLHTLAFYMDSFSGDITIQGTLEDTTDPTEWIDIDTTTYTTSDLTYANINGIWSHLRIKHTLANGTLDKILYRY